MKTTRVTWNNFPEYFCTAIYSVNVVDRNYLQQERRKASINHLLMKLSEISEHKDVGYDGENWEIDVKGHKKNEWSDNDAQ